ncbi:aldo/keto reductase [Mesonia maritima]|uniref:Aryl-alcohol dehydrogenase-like predicted oxidoreductase n=1 Tax=Mesonia maritima TaxID=1793873 RepID=A0ABU1K943_9FLAO|nr:aldo/keto reductase [Mesonia maritima]MDR6302111.1 aryl-alcohol dehydrogenase-like predicted oxidoreductase [Mesonia maritima]
MNYKKLGETDLQTPPIVFGGNVFGWTLNEKESFRMLDELFEKGFNFIDTADVYSRWAEGNEGGESERIIGKWMKDRSRRNDIVLATKVGSSMKQGGSKDISKSHILKAVEDSLQRLQTDRIDLYFTHFDDDKTPVDETLSAYEQLIKEGKVRNIGASNLSADRLKESLQASKENNLPKYKVFQPEYNLLERENFENNTLPVCKEYNLAVTNYFSLASGFLTGKYRKEEDFEGQDRKDFVEKYLNRRGLETLNALDEIAKEHNISNAGVALAWLIQRPGVTAPIASATKSSHLKSFTEAINTTLSKEEMGKLNEVSKK